MEFPHCPICMVMAFVSFFIGLTRSYMLFSEFMSPKSDFKLKFIFN